MKPVVIRDQLGRVITIDGDPPKRMPLWVATREARKTGGHVEAQGGRWIYVPGEPPRYPSDRVTT